MLLPLAWIDQDERQFNSWISLQAIVKFGLASSFPHGQDEASFADIAAASSLPEATVRRLLRHAMAFRIFQEPSEGIVRHTTASKTLADTPLLRQWMGMVSEELWPAATKVRRHAFRYPRWPLTVDRLSKHSLNGQGPRNQTTR